jgi:hypothetical protein
VPQRSSRARGRWAPGESRRTPRANQAEPRPIARPWCVLRPTWALVPPALGHSFQRTWARSERSDGLVPPERSDEWMIRWWVQFVRCRVPSSCGATFPSARAGERCARGGRRSRRRWWDRRASRQLFVGSWVVITVDDRSYRSSRISSRSRRSVSLRGAMRKSSRTRTSVFAMRASRAA